jgi:DNA polymerase V
MVDNIDVYEKVYICIDLKCFYASVECVDRGLNPFKSNLVVADSSRGKGGICLAISPAMKKLGIKNRCRLFEIPDNVNYIIAKPRMKRYMDISAKIYSIYLKYVSSEDIHIYSIDECFIDVTPYITLYNKTPKEIAIMLINAVNKETGICAAVGVGTNMFLAKVALDITAKKSPNNIGILTEDEFKKTIWTHRPITDIWGIGRGIAKRLDLYGIYDLKGITKINKDVLFKEFGINAEILLDHAYGIEPCTMQEIKNFKTKSNSISNSQILFEDYNFENAFTAVKEMVDMLSLELTEKNMVTNTIYLSIGYSKNIIPRTGEMKKLQHYTDNFSELSKAFEKIYYQTTNTSFPIRKINIGFGNIVDKDLIDVQLSLLNPIINNDIQKAMVKIKNKYGKNAILRGMSLQKHATAQKRNKLVGGHNAE